MRWSKVIQYQTRTFDIPLPRLSGNMLCPVTALINYLHLTSGADLSGPAFVYPVNSQLKPVTSEIFIGRVRECLSSEAVNQLDIATHSFRRGAVSFSHLSGLSADSIKLMGDWRSGCYASYIDNSVTTRLELIRNSNRIYELPSTYTTPYFGTLDDILLFSAYNFYDCGAHNL